MPFDLTGQKFGKLLVIREWIGIRSSSGAVRAWECKCDCGRVVNRRQSNLRSGNVKSCGCSMHERAPKHGHATSGHSKTYKSWHDMKSRCLNPRSNAFKDYGGRGIKVCDRWMDFVNFLSDMGEVPFGMTLERINNNGNYEPGNCKWATQKEQLNNTRNTAFVILNGERLPFTSAVEKIGIPYSTLASRLRRGFYKQGEIILCQRS